MNVCHGHSNESCREQNVAASGVAVVVVVSPTNRLKELRPLVPAILDALSRVRRGELIQVGA